MSDYNGFNPRNIDNLNREHPRGSEVHDPFQSGYTIDDAKRDVLGMFGSTNKQRVLAFIESQAAEIERLRSQLEGEQENRAACHAFNAELNAEIERLRTRIHNGDAIQRATTKDRDHYKEMYEQQAAEIERLRETADQRARDAYLILVGADAEQSPSWGSLPDEPATKALSHNESEAQRRTARRVL